MICPHCGKETLPESIDFDKIMYNFTKFNPEIFKKDGKWMVSFVVSVRNRIEKMTSLEQIKQFMETYYNCVLNNDLTFSLKTETERWKTLG